MFSGHNLGSTSGGSQDADGGQPKPDNVASLQERLGARWSRWLLSRSYSMGKSRFKLGLIYLIFLPRRLGSRLPPRELSWSSLPLKSKRHHFLPALTPGSLACWAE